jgi:hypothetical protein
MAGPAWALLPGCLLVAGAAAAGSIANPYWKEPVWKLWAQDETPVVGQGLTLTPPAATNRLYPDAASAPGTGRFLTVRTGDWVGRESAGFWDDVYICFDRNANGTPHSWMRGDWAGRDGNAIDLTRRFLTGHQPYYYGDIHRAGATFTSQSTTGMGHDIANSADRTGSNCIPVLERDWYFANCLRAGPAHISYRDNHFYEMIDAYQALSPCYFNSFGSSGSETPALTKMLIAGGHLPRAMKAELKRNGLYIPTLLYLWKAALPYDVPYGHELRHRVAYNADGGRIVGEALVNSAYHLYDDTAHLRNMVAMARAQTTAPPLALLRRVDVQGATETYFTKTTALLQQTSNQTVCVRASTDDSFDLQGRPLTFRWQQLYGSPGTTIEREGTTTTWRITVPWDARLPRGRTSILLIANNGVCDGNPACVNIYKPSGVPNHRPTLTGLEDRVILPGETVTYHIESADPDGFPVSLYRRPGEVGTLSGDTFSWRTSSGTATGTYPVAVIASDGTGGINSREARITVTPVVARLAAAPAAGGVPLAVTFSSQGSADAQGQTLSYAWDFDDGATSAAPCPTHTFAEPGFYRVRLAVSSPLGVHTNETIVHAQHAWPLQMSNGWTSAGLDPAAWEAPATTNGSVTVVGDRLQLTQRQGPLMLQTACRYEPPFYVETTFTKHWASAGDGFHLLGCRIGWSGNSSAPISIRNLATSNQVNIGCCLSDPTLEEATLRVYVTADPLHPGRVRYAGYLNGLLGQRFFRMDNQPVAQEPCKISCCFARLDLHRWRIWMPCARAGTPP